MKHPRPFVYISALRRTGSTMLSEVLTDLPLTFVFHETHMGKNAFSLSATDQAHLKAHGVDVESFLRVRKHLAFCFRRLRWLGYPQDYMLKAFKRVLFSQMIEHGFLQIGVKEIKHEGWQYYVQQFPNMKVLMLGRDPRDMYISSYRKWRRGTTQWKDPFNPQTFADDLLEQFSHQRALRANADTLDLRYALLCRDPALIKKARAFCRSPLSKPGAVGQYVGSQPKRVNEHRLHGDAITTLSVNRWKREKDVQLLEDAHAAFELVSEYNEFWGYTH